MRPPAVWQEDDMKTKNLWACEKGQGLTEYLMIMILVAIVSIVAVRTMGERVKSKIEEASNHINSDIVIR
jgi:hypothetical protein